jgi:lipoprotein-anchoring transpeptidase ErfK/SrfK
MCRPGPASSLITMFNRGVNVKPRLGRVGLVLVALLAGTTALAGCQSGSGPGAAKSGGSGAGAGSVVAEPAAAQVTIAPSDGTAKVALDDDVTVRVAQGTISTVSVSTSKGRTLKGSLSSDQASWTSLGHLAAASTYTVSVDASSKDGKKTSTSSSFTTLTPKGSVTASIEPSSGLTVGVGMPVIVNLSKPVSTSMRSGVEQALTVSTASDVEGAWRWMTSQQVQWRPKTYWPAHTKVAVTADLAGVQIRSGVWGSTRKRTSNFSIGSAMISTVDVAAHKMTVRKDGKVLRVIPVTTGKADMATRNGIKVIMSRETSHEMDSTSIGIKKGDPGYYDIVAKYAMRLTYSGEFLHAAPWSTGSQGRANVSHGCTGMTTAAAQLLFNQSKLGDVVVYKNSTRKLEWGNGFTAWNMPYSQWKSA